jgi:hypothetical protein
MKTKILVLSAVFLFVISSSAYAVSTSVAAKVSTLGLGGEGEVSITDSIGIRVGYNYYTYSFSAVESGIDYDFDLNLSSAPVILDYHPLKGSFRLSAGALYNGNNLEAYATNPGTINVGGVDFNSTQIATVSSDIEFNTVAPYLGFGWDTTFGDEDGGFGFSCEAGALFQGEASASLSATGTAAAAAAAQLAAEEAELEDSLSEFTIYPVISFGINYRF